MKGCTHLRKYWDDGYCRCRAKYIGPCNYCDRKESHHHCNECGTVGHGAAYCDSYD